MMDEMMSQGQEANPMSDKLEVLKDLKDYLAQMIAQSEGGEKPAEEAIEGSEPPAMDAEIPMDIEQAESMPQEGQEDTASLQEKLKRFMKGQPEDGEAAPSKPKKTAMMVAVEAKKSPIMSMKKRK